MGPDPHREIASASRSRSLPCTRKPGARGRLRRIALAFLLFGLAAAAAQGQPNPPSFTPRDESPEEFPAGPGRDETFFACTPCHNFRLVAQQGMDRERWDETLTFMTVRHNMPPLQGAERKLVLDYLERNYPSRVPAGRRGWQSPFAPR